VAATLTRTIGTVQDPSHRPVKVGRAAVAVAIVLFALGTWAAWSFTVDDAFITWRYSANLAAGSGPTWNPGEDPVEGFTNFAWMVWHAPFAAAGLNLDVVAALTSVAFGLAIMVMLLRDARSTVGAATAAGAFLLFLPTYFHITSGLETVAFAAVVLRAVILGLRVTSGFQVRSWEPPLLLLGAGLLRPEGIAAVLPAVLVWLWPHRRSRTAWTWAGAAAVIGIGYFVWRWSYYGQLLPNTFYVKFGNIGAGVTWLEITAAALLPLLVLSGALLLRNDIGPGLLIVSTVVSTYAVYLVSGPSMDYLHRFAFHAYPVLCLAAGLALGDVRRRGVAAALGAATVAWVGVAGYTADDLPTIANYGPDLARTHVAIGKGLADADVPSDQRTVAVSDAGAIPYWSGWSTLDYIGLTDERITAGMDVDERVAKFDPTVLVVTGTGREPRADPYGLDTTTATVGYVRVIDVRMRDGYSQHVFVTPEYAREVREAVQPVVATAQRGNDSGRFDLTIDRWLDRLRTGLMP
jgi:arabinofuranosyltransferase